MEMGKSRLVGFSSVLLLVLLMGCAGDKGVYGIFESDFLGRSSTISFEGTKAHFSIGGVVMFTYDCELTGVESVATGQRYEGIEFKDRRTGSTFYAKILEKNSSGEVMAIYISLPGFGRYRRIN